MGENKIILATIDYQLNAEWILGYININAPVTLTQISLRDDWNRRELFSDCMPISTIMQDYTDNSKKKRLTSLFLRLPIAFKGVSVLKKEWMLY